VAFTIRLADDQVAEIYQQLQPYAQKSFDEALRTAADGDFRSLVTLPGLPEDCYTLSFADHRGLALLEADEDQNVIIVRQIQAPR
jgi:hypothetical protein